MRLILTLLLLSLAPVSARPDDPSPASGQQPVSSAAAPGGAQDSAQFSRLGLQLDAGAPDGAGLALLYRPWWWMRLNGGLAYNVIGIGLRGGVTFMPFRWAVTPTLSLDAGHYFSGDLNKFVKTENIYEKALLSQAAYNFASAQVGLEFGSQDGFLFYLRGGLTYLSAHLAGKDLTDYANSTFGSGSSEQYQFGDANFTAVLPTVSLGFMIFLF
jgi:hypothetical protein